MQTINVFVPPLHPIAPGDDENKAASASAEDVAVMREMEKVRPAWDGDGM